MTTKSSWKTIRLDERHLQKTLRSKHSLRLHGMGLGTMTLLITWLTSHALMVLGVRSMGLRYGLALLVGYMAYLVLVRAWAKRLAIQRNHESQSYAELVVDAMDLPVQMGRFNLQGPAMISGKGGDFGGGGATVNFGDSSDTGLSVSSGSSDWVSHAVGGAFKGAGEAVGSADEGVVVVIPVVAIFLMVFLAAMGMGSIVFLYFGSETLLAVAVELAFSYAASTAAVKIAREGWLNAIFRLTWKPLAGALLCAVMMGFVLDVYFPQAKSMFDAVRQIRGM